MARQFGNTSVNASQTSQVQESKVDYSYVSKACVIGTSDKGPAFVPVTVSNLERFLNRLSNDSSGSWDGAVAARSWFSTGGIDNNLTYVRLLGVGDGKKRNLDGTVSNAGFTVGEKLPEDFSLGNWSPLTRNPFAESGGPPGRTYFLGTFMSGSSRDNVDLDGIQPGPEGIPLIRGVLMAPSGVVLTLKNSLSNPQPPTASSNALQPSGSSLGSLLQFENSMPTSQFVLFLNGHKSTQQYPNVITSSFRNNDQNVFYTKLNTDPLKIQQAGHYLYSYWDVPGFEENAGSLYSSSPSLSPLVFILSGSCDHNSGSNFTPNYECFEDRFSCAKTPWVISQEFDGKNKNLFRFHLRDDGAGFSSKYKFVIHNLRKGTIDDPYGKFDLSIRPWDRSDKLDEGYIEKFIDLDLNPYSSNFISKKIGDVREYYDFEREIRYQNFNIDGDYPNRSELIRVEVSDDVKNYLIDESSLPVGFRGISHLVTSGSTLSGYYDNNYQAICQSLKHVKEPPLPFVKKIDIQNPTPWGIYFEELEEKNKTHLNGFVKYYPNFSTNYMNFCVGENTGQSNTPENGVLDSDVFNYNMFSLENINVHHTNNVIDDLRWSDAIYVRNGETLSDMKKVRIPEDMTLNNGKYLSFSFVSQGGFDGVNIFDPEESKISHLAAECDMENPERGLASGPSVTSYMKALEMLEKTDLIDFQLLAIPGMKNELVTNAAIKLAEDSFDSLYLMDIWGYDSGNNPVTGSTQVLDVDVTAQRFNDRQINSSFVSVYFPDVIAKISNNLYVNGSATSAALGAFSLNDSVGYPWTAPAGNVRGRLSEVTEVKHSNLLTHVKQLNLDRLYDVNINPIIHDANNVLICGQKTALRSNSSLGRINTRRLMIDIRRTVREVVESGFMFGQNRIETLGNLQEKIDDSLQKYQKLSAIDAYKVEVDLNQTTQSDIEGNVIRGKIVIRARRTEELISEGILLTKIKGIQ